MTLASIFRFDSLSLMTDRYADFEEDFRDHRSDDQVASFFYQLVFDLITRTAYTARKISPHGKEEFSRAVAAFLPGESARYQELARIYSDRKHLEDIVKENYIFLDMLRGIYRDFIRGMKPECWESLLLAVKAREARCGRHDSCYPEGGAESPAESLKCEKFQVNWRTTSLTVEENGGIAGARELLRKIYTSCPLLELVTDPRKLEDFLLREYCGNGQGRAGHRSIRGLPVRLLTAFAGHSLGNLSDLLGLPPEKRYTFLA